eukprot:scaffold427_cov263-Pinguiococcus_pyrenoidosus.AAC.5
MLLSAILHDRALASCRLQKQLVQVILSVMVSRPQRWMAREAMIGAVDRTYQVAVKVVLVPSRDFKSVGPVACLRFGISSEFQEGLDESLRRHALEIPAASKPWH